MWSHWCFKYILFLKSFRTDPVNHCKWLSLFFLTRFESKDAKQPLVVFIYHFPYTLRNILTASFSTFHWGFPNIYLSSASTFTQGNSFFLTLVCHCYRRRSTSYFVALTYAQISSVEFFSECATHESLAGITVISNYSVDIRQCIVFSVRTSGRNVNIFSISRTFFES